MVARRGFLAGAAALAATGCGRSASDDEPGGAPEDRMATSRRGDIELLQAALALEAGGRAAYAELAKAARGRDRAALTRFAAHEAEHVRRLQEAIQELRGEAEVGWTAYAADGDEPVGAAIDIHGRAIVFYLDMLPKVYDAGLRTMVASILVVESEQLAALRELAGERPAPDAFVYGFQS